MEWVKLFIEAVFSFGLFINAALFIPQAARIYKAKSAKGLSLLTFGGFSLTQLFTILHGIIHKDVLLTIGYILAFITCGAVTTLIIVYRDR